jgi:hypothetical protein
MTILSTILVLLAAVLGEVPPGLDLPLTDLDGKSVAVSTILDGPTVVMVVTARRLRGLKAWERALRERYGDLGYVRIADVPADPGVTLEHVTDKLRDRVPAGVQVLIDLERRWAEGLQLETNRPNLLLLNRRGELAGVFQGRYDDSLLEQVCAVIDGMRSEP